MSNSLPDWAKVPINDFIDYQENNIKILELCMQGISIIRHLPKAVKLLRETAHKNEKIIYGDKKVADAEQRAIIANKELENGFPLLHAQMTISLWSSVESLCRTFLVAWLNNIPEARTCNELLKVKIRYGEFASLSGDDQYFYLLDLLEDSLSTRRCAGIGRFEALFNAFGLSSIVNEKVKKDLLELYHIRNVLVHRRGIADKKFIDSCPWLSLSVGQPIIIDHVNFMRYDNSCIEYVLEIMYRTKAYLGIENVSDKKNQNET